MSRLIPLSSNPLARVLVQAKGGGRTTPTSTVAEEEPEGEEEEAQPVRKAKAKPREKVQPLVLPQPFSGNFSLFLAANSLLIYDYRSRKLSDLYRFLM